MLCSLSAKNLPTMQFMPLIITSQCDLSVKIANTLSCVCQESLFSAEQLFCQVLAGAYLFPGILHAYETLMPHSDSGLARCVLVLTTSSSLTSCGTNVFTTACRAFTNRHHLHFLHCLFNSSLFQHHLSVNPCLYLRENMFWVLNVKTKLCYSVISCILYTRATKCHCRNRHSHYFLSLFETTEDLPLPVPLKPS